MMTRYELRSCAGVWMADFERREHADFWAGQALWIRPRVLDMLLPRLDCVRVVRVRGRSRRTVATVRRAGGRRP